MLSVPTLAQMLTVIAVALLGTAALVSALSLLIERTGTGRPNPARRIRVTRPTPQVTTFPVPAQRTGDDEHAMTK